MTTHHPPNQKRQIRYYIQQIGRPRLWMPPHFLDHTTPCHHENTRTNTTLTITHTHQSNKHSIQQYHHGTNRINPRPAPSTKRPADITIRFSPWAKQMNQPIAKLQLLDATIPHPPSVPTGPNECLINLKTLAIFADKLSHITSTKEKYQGKTTPSGTQTTIAAITKRNQPPSSQSKLTNWQDWVQHCPQIPWNTRHKIPTSKPQTIILSRGVLGFECWGGVALLLHQAVQASSNGRLGVFISQF